jgi:hypothetical protein
MRSAMRRAREGREEREWERVREARWRRKVWSKGSVERRRRIREVRVRVWRSGISRKVRILRRISGGRELRS